MVWYQYPPTWRVLALPFFVAVACAASMGAGLWLAALNVKYRDFRYVIPFVVQFGLYLSPVGFSSSIVPERWRLLIAQPHGRDRRLPVIGAIHVRACPLPRRRGAARVRNDLLQKTGEVEDI
jgi:hypothetical protein